MSQFTPSQKLANAATLLIFLIEAFQGHLTRAFIVIGVRILLSPIL